MTIEYNRSMARLPEVLSDQRVREYMAELYEPKYLAVALSRWKKGPQYPPVDVLVEMAMRTDSNVDYILGLTDINVPVKKKKRRKKRKLEDLRKAARMSETELFNALNRDHSMLTRYKEHLPLNRISSLISLAKALNLSVDYILGLTDWENWEIYSGTKNEYRKFVAGSAAFLVADKKCKSYADILKAIEKKDGRFCLVSDDGNTVLFPNGAELDISDAVLDGAYFVDVKPED